jgi:alkylation response protein AidB-like acyl-CoA dehydrogenase
MDGERLGRDMRLERLMTSADSLSRDLLTALAKHAGSADSEAIWPQRSFDLLRELGALRWCIPKQYGGDGHTGLDLLEHYEVLAGACLTSCFLLSQRDAACRRLRDSGSDALREELLPGLARGERFATVGLSQLTTSRQHVKPSLAASLNSTGLVVDGVIPWVTGASRAEHIVIGGVLEDGRQVLAVLPMDLPGITVGPPLDLMALEGSITAEVHLNKVVLDRRWLLAGPAERVLQVGRGGTGGLETSCLALGLAGAAIAHVRQEAEARPDLKGMADRLDRVRKRLRAEMHQLALSDSAPDAAVVLRSRANTLVLQATQAALTVSKGTGYLRRHPAQRWARQALFFLVWSCPWQAAAATLDALALAGEPQVCS